jgi:hypothetical protein
MISCSVEQQPAFDSFEPAAQKSPDDGQDDQSPALVF